MRRDQQVRIAFNVSSVIYTDPDEWQRRIKELILVIKKNPNLKNMVCFLTPLLLFPFCSVFFSPFIDLIIHSE